MIASPPNYIAHPRAMTGGMVLLSVTRLCCIETIRRAQRVRSHVLRGVTQYAYCIVPCYDVARPPFSLLVATAGRCFLLLSFNLLSLGIRGEKHLLLCPTWHAMRFSQEPLSISVRPCTKLLAQPLQTSPAGRSP